MDGVWSIPTTSMIPGELVPACEEMADAAALPQTAPPTIWP
jgi:hypothetical protein